MRRTVSVLVSTFFACGSVLWFPSPQVHAGPRAPTQDPLVTNAQESSPFRYRSDRYRDPFLPKSVVRNAPGPSLQGQDVGRRTVKVVGITSSAQGRWAVLEFDHGERLIVMVGQVLSASSQFVKRITDHGVTLSAMEGKAGLQPERTYTFYEERDFFEPRSSGDSRKPDW